MANMTANSEAGFTIVELIVTLVVLGMFLVSIGNLMTGISATQHDTDLLAIATHAGSDEIESLRNNTYNSLTDGQSIDFTSQLPSSLPKGSTGTVKVTQPSGDLRRVDVTITYPVGDGNHSVVLSSLIGRIGIGK